MSLFAIRRPAALMGAIVGIVLASAAHAQTIVFDNGDANNSNAFKSDYAGGLNCADTFTLTSTATFNQVVWYGIYGFAQTNTPPVADTFTITFYNTNAAGTPNATAFSTFAIGNANMRAATGANIFGFATYKYSSALPSDVTLPAGNYGIAVVNNTVADTDDDWFWALSSQSGTYYNRATPTANYVSSTGNMAFRLENNASAPEPGSIALLGMGLVGGVSGLSQARRRRFRHENGR